MEGKTNVRLVADKAAETFKAIKTLNKIQNRVEREAKIKEAKDLWWQETKEYLK